MTGIRVLLVEGSDDEHVVKHICGNRGLGKIDRIRDCEGKARLLDLIPIQLKESELFALGILLDADTDLLASWQAVTDRLVTAGYAGIPSEPDPAGTVVAPPADSLLPRVGVWLMPDNRVPGILEDFLRFLVPAAHPLMGHVEQSIDSIPSGHRLFADLKRPKACIHTWLAWQDEPGKPLGLSITARYLDPNQPAAGVFADWLHRTFFET